MKNIMSFLSGFISLMLAAFEASNAYSDAELNAAMYRAKSGIIFGE